MTQVDSVNFFWVFLVQILLINFCHVSHIDTAFADGDLSIEHIHKELWYTLKNYGNTLKNSGNSSSILILHMYIFVLCLKVRVKDVERDACYHWQFYADMAI